MVKNKMGSKEEKKKARSSVWKIILLTILSILILITVTGAGVVLAIIETAPEIDVNEVLSLSEPSKIFDDKDQFMDIVSTDEKRTVISFKDMPQDLRNAFVSIEDERFNSHKGIDPKRIVGAAYRDVLNIIQNRPGIQGASTITQQLIRNTILTQERSWKRKIQEAYLAIKLEKCLSKDQILEAYMNTIFLGGNSYGVEAASNQYFDKPANQLNLVECAFIAGIPQSPTLSYLSAFGKKDASMYLNRTKSVLYKMYENKYITKEQYTKSVDDLLQKKLAFKKTTNNTNRLNYEWFSIPAMQQVKNDLKAQYHYSDSDVEHLLMYGGLKIYTTMNKELQDYSQKIIDDDNNLGVKSTKDKNGIVQPQASAVIMDYSTGQVKVIIGGRGSQPPRSYNRAASNGFLRPSGSSIKPLTVYGPAIDTKAATPATVIEDSPLSEEIGKKYSTNGKPYNPRNYDSVGFKGYVTLRTAITYSINLVAIKLEDQIGLRTGAQYAEKFGINLDSHDKTSIAALALGQLHINTSGNNPSGVNTLTMASAFGTFGNEGIYTNPILYTKVVDRSGKVLIESKKNTRKVLSPQSAYIMYDLLKGPVESPYGTAPNAKFSSMPAAGKTGTSGDKKDFWFCGLTPYYSGSVWIGNDNPTTYYNIFSSTSAGLWSKIMAEAHKNLSVKDIEEPSGIVKMAVCRDSGKISTELCTRDPRGNRTYTESFIQGSVPTDICDTHVEAKVNKLTGKLASEFTPSFLTETMVFIKRDYATSSSLEDQSYVLPKEFDDTKPKPEPPKQDDDTNKQPDNSDTENSDINTNNTDVNNDTENTDDSNSTTDTNNSSKNNNSTKTNATDESTGKNKKK